MKDQDSSNEAKKDDDFTYEEKTVQKISVDENDIEMNFAKLVLMKSQLFVWRKIWKKKKQIRILKRKIWTSDSHDSTKKRKQQVVGKIPAGLFPFLQI